MAEERGGKCLSDTYVDRSTKLPWQCGKEHIWEATPSNIINRKSWCPTCAREKRRNR
ncbi:zinc-ribbon domain-containing protein [Nitrospinae bacterium AH_259_B05_G02_I21]|nr:zinc-ribbon domain-containing protein [Nitrospinae bacterium AH_259_B05_G02_I21]MDA2932617.1 zinc-ribbon domain-containing protein [Nitrospinae bacterium AH-259-F20]